MAAITVTLLMIGCGDGRRNQTDETGNAATSAATADSSTMNTDDPLVDDQRVVLFLGTSLTAGYGLSAEQSYPAVIEEKIREEGLPYRVVNAGVSGETSAGALRRIDWLLQQPFDVLVLETGSNDMLRGTNPAETERNIQAIVDRVRERRPGATLLLVGMLAAPNLGPEYVSRFEAIYPRIAERNGVILLPFLLEGVAAVPELNQADGIHPNASGHRIVAETVWKALEPVMRETSDSTGNTAVDD